MKTLSRIFRARKMRLRELSHTNLGITSIYLQSIDSAEVIDTVHARRPASGPSGQHSEDVTQLPVVVRSGSPAVEARRL